MAYGIGIKAGAAAAARPAMRRAGTGAAGTRSGFRSGLIRWAAFAAGVATVALLLVMIPLAATWLMVAKMPDHAMLRTGERIERRIYLGTAQMGAPSPVEAASQAYAASQLKFADKLADRIPSLVALAPPAEDAAAPADAPPPAPSVAEASLPAAPVTFSKAPPKRMAARPAPAKMQLASASTTVVVEPEEKKTLVEKLFASLTPSNETEADKADDDVTGSISGSVTAYANPNPPRDSGPNRVAVYDIVNHTVHMPNGERLEAHSGLGAHFDNPDSLRLRMRGVTPPNVYRLTMRESLFHGVAAIRLNPVFYDRMNGRDGMLAHTYMLGPRGESNGCVSFRNYDRFLAAFRRGEVTHMVVVPRVIGTPAAVIASHRIQGTWASAEGKSKLR